MQAHALPRVAIVRESIGKSIIVKTGSVKEALAFSNDYAPEHLILHLRDAQGAVELVENAGSVFVGAFSPERLVPSTLSDLNVRRLFSNPELIYQCFFSPFQFQLRRLRVGHEPHTAHQRLRSPV